MQVDERHHNEGESRRGQPRGPVVHAKVLEHKHRPPIIECRLFQPWATVKIGSDAGAQPVLDGVRRVKPHQHLVRDLRVARLVGPHQAQPVTAEKRSDSVDEKSDRENQEGSNLEHSAPARQTPMQFTGRIRIGWLQKGLKVAEKPAGQPFAPAFGRVLRRWFLNSFHFQRFSSGTFTQSGNSGFGHDDWGRLTGPGSGPRSRETRKSCCASTGTRLTDSDGFASDLSDCSFV